MKIRKSSRIMALVLALMMIVPLIGVPTFAEDAQAPALNVLWSTDMSSSENTQSSNGNGSVFSTAKDDPSNAVLEFDLTPKGKADYYWYVDSSNYGVITGGTVENNTLTKGSATVGGTAYEISGAINDDTAAPTVAATVTDYTAKTVYIVTGGWIDVNRGFVGHVSNPFVFKNAPVTNDGKNDIVIAMEFYLSEGAVLANNFFDVRARAGSSNVELFRISADGTNATIKERGNSKKIKGATPTVALGEWFNVTVVIDQATAALDIYVNGVYGFSAENSTPLNKAIDLNANSLQFEVGRNGTSVDNLKGYIQIDDIAIYNGTEGMNLSSVLYENDFEQYETEGATPSSSEFNTITNNLSVVTKDGNKVMKVVSNQNNNQTKITNPALSGAMKLAYEIDYYLPSTSEGRMQVQLSARGKDSTGADKSYSFCDVYQILVKDGKAAIGREPLTDIANGYPLPVDKWVTVSVVLDMATATYDIYVDGEMTRFCGQKLGVVNASITSINANGFYAGKVNDKTGLAKGEFYVDNISLALSDVPVETSFYETFETLDGLLSTGNGNSVSPVAPDYANLHAEAGTAFIDKNTYFNVQSDAGDTNKYLHMPFWGFYGTYEGANNSYGGNADQFYKVAHSTLTPANGIVELNFKMRPVNKTGVASRAEFRTQCLYYGSVDNAKPATKDNWYAFFDVTVNKSNCSLGGKLGNKTGVVPLLNVWNDMKLVIDMESGWYWLYINGALAGYTDTGRENLYIDAATPLRLANLYKSTASYYTTDIDTANYIDLDEINIVASSDTDFVEGVPEIQLYSKWTQFFDVLKEQDTTFMRIPWIQTSTATNYDKYLLAKNAAFSATDYTKISFKIRPNYNETVGGAPAIEFQIEGYGFTDEGGATHSGSWYSFGQYGLKTGEKKTGYGEVVENATGLKQNEWNDMVFLFNPKDGSSITYINGELYAYNNAYTAQWWGDPDEDSKSQWVTCPNSTNYTVDANKFVIAKCNKTDGYATTADATDYSYVDIDAVTFETVTLVDMYKGILETVDGASIRLGDAPNANANATTTGIRFATELDMAKLEELITVFGEENVQFGTLIAPSDHLTEGNLTAALGDGNYLDVQANYGHYYAVDQDDETTHFVGSITNVFEANLGRKFSARGYITVTLTDGSEVTLYGDIVERSVKQVATAALADPNASWTPEEITELTGYTNVDDWVAPAN